MTVLPRIAFFTSGASLYGIRTYDTETSTGIELLVRVDESNTTSFIVEPLLSGKKYRFAVTSKTNVGTESEESSPVFERIGNNKVFISEI